MTVKVMCGGGEGESGNCKREEAEAWPARLCAHMYHRSDLSDSMDDWLCSQAFLTQLINLTRETDG